MKYRQRGTEVSAMGWTGGSASAAEVVAWLGDVGWRAAYVPATGAAPAPAAEEQGAPTDPAYRPEAIFLESQVSGAQTVVAPAWFALEADGVRVYSPEAFEERYEEVMP